MVRYMNMRNMRTHRSTTMNNTVPFLNLLQSIDAFFPVGAFTLSNGLEDYVVRERMTCSDDLRKYLKGFMQIFPYNDLGILSHAYTHFNDIQYIMELDDIAAASKSASEVRAGTIRMCSRYLKARQAIGDCQGQLEKYADAVADGAAAGIHPIALGIYGAEVMIEQQLLLLMYGYSVLSAIVNNAVKLVPLSPMDGQKILYACMGEMEELADKAAHTKLTEMGVSGAAYEIHCMNHEKLYSRQYSS